MVSMHKVSKPKCMEAGKKEPRKKNYIRLIVEHIQYYLSVACIHGLNHIVRRRRLVIERIFWICAVLASLCFGLLKGYEVFMHYYERPFVVSVELDYKNWKNNFPSATICQESLRTNVDEILQQLNISYSANMKSYLNLLAFSNYHSYYKFEQYANGSKREYLNPEEYLPVLLKVVSTISTAVSLNEFTTSMKFPFGQPRPIFTSLSELGVCTTVNPSAGIYYTADYFNTSSSIPYEYKPILYNFSITNLKYYTADIQGVYSIYLHSPHEMIDITSKGIHAEIVRKSTVNFGSTSVWTTDEVKHLSVMQRQCKLNNDIDGLDHSPVYSYLLCRMECRIKLCLKYCNCTPYYYRRNHGEKVCNMAGMYCLSHYKDELMYLQSSKTNKSICNCLQNCNDDLVFVTQFTTLDWFMTTVLIVELVEAPRVRYVRKLVYSRTDLLVQVGGILGLCLGSSIISIIEIAYFLTLRLYWCVVKGKSIKKSI